MPQSKKQQARHQAKKDTQKKKLGLTKPGKQI
jgi:hypothetical protein